MDSGCSDIGRLELSVRESASHEGEHNVTCELQEIPDDDEWSQSDINDLQVLEVGFMIWCEWT